MPKTCECGGSIKRGILGAECSACGLIVDGVRSAAPCLHGERLAGVGRCKVASVPEESVVDVYSQLTSSVGCPMDSRCAAFVKNPDYVKTAARQFCAYMDDAGNCVQQVYDVGAGGEFLLDSRRDLNIGKCPYRDDIQGQKDCAIAQPDPSWPAPQWFPIQELNRTAAREVMSHWSDVRNKAVRLRSEGRVKLLRNDAQFVTAEVEGDNGEYVVTIERQDPTSWSVSTWSCDCDWGKWAFKRQITFVGRMCSHAYATLMSAQSEKMTGEGIILWQNEYDESRAKAACADGECHYCENDAEVVEATSGEKLCHACMDGMVIEAARDALINGIGHQSTHFLEANLGREAAVKLLVDYVDDDSRVTVGGKTGAIQFTDNSGSYAQVVFTDGSSSLLPMNSICREAQVVTQSFKDKVSEALSAAMGGQVEFVTVMFSTHWSQRVVGEFTYAGEKYAYEYTQSTGRVQVTKQESPIAQPQVEVDTSTQKVATRFFSHSEQQELQDESRGALARNFDRANIEDTHYRMPDAEGDEVGFGLEGLFS